MIERKNGMLHLLGHLVICIHNFLIHNSVRCVPMSTAMRFLTPQSALCVVKSIESSDASHNVFFLSPSRSLTFTASSCFSANSVFVVVSCHTNTAHGGSCLRAMKTRIEITIFLPNAKPTKFVVFSQFSLETVLSCD